MIYMLISLTMYMYSLALICFIIEFKHLLITMVCLEFMALVMFMTLSTLYTLTPFETIYSLLYIPIAACEASLGLSIMVLYVTKKGDELLKIF
uniref:NADH-ubiquinone oxidoreductase chain 4L n=1 Tax=Porcellionides pruinosus TaxID=96870 RepID=A0A1P8DKJ6_PORPN|nr:NADH dehydrogenase subunit 4L [Porcellionides pruinosus]